MVVSSDQLSPCDTKAVIQPNYKIGDRVKLRKKPRDAFSLKKGDVVKSAVVHPLDGSIKFWNERSERWEFIHPDEIGSILKSHNSVTPVEVAVTELTPELATHNSVTSAEVAVTELTPELATHNSVTSAEVAVTELTPELAAHDLGLNAISTYSPRGTAPQGHLYRYYRLSYREGNRVRHQHIRGGNIDSPIAQAKVAEVRSLLVAGVSPQEIATMLRTNQFKSVTK